MLASESNGDHATMQNQRRLTPLQVDHSAEDMMAQNTGTSMDEEIASPSLIDVEDGLVTPSPFGGGREGNTTTATASATTTSKAPVAQSSTVAASPDAASSSPAATILLVKNPEDMTESELEQVLTEQEVVDMDSEMMDPIEWTVRKTIPIPARYYWDVVRDDTVQQARVPWRIKLWHHTVAAATATYQWTEKYVGKPLVDVSGINNNRFDYVTDFMTPEQWEQSKRVADERKKKRLEYEQQQERKELAATQEELAFPAELTNAL